MKNIAILAALAMLAACTPATETDTPPEAPTAADGGPSAGQYRATDATGAVLIEDLRPDGSYTFMDEDRSVLEDGKWVQKSKAELCFTANTAGAAETCYSEEVRPDGIWYSTKAGTNDTAIIERLKG